MPESVMAFKLTANIPGHGRITDYVWLTDKAGKEYIMKLEELLGEELFKQVKEKLDAANSKEPDKLKHIRYVDLSEGEYVSKSKYEALEAAKNSAETQLKTATDSLKKFEGVDTDKLNEEITKLQGELSSQKKAAESIQKEYALKDKLREAGVLDADYVIYKQGGVEKFTFDKEGKPVGVDDILKPMREASPHLFQAGQGAEYHPAGGGKPPVKNPFAKDSFNLTEQGRLIKENPEQAKQMAAAAGVTI